MFTSTQFIEHTIATILSSCQEEVLLVTGNRESKHWNSSELVLSPEKALVPSALDTVPLNTLI